MVMVFNDTFKKNSVIYCDGRLYWCGGGHRSTQEKPMTCRKSLTNFIT